MKAKLIEYAYPSSVRATIAGYGKTGCWFVMMYPTIDATFTKEEPLAFYATKEQAKAHANQMPEPYNNMMKYFEPA